MSNIKQIRGVEGIVWAFYNKMSIEVWHPEKIAKVKKQLNVYGFKYDLHIVDRVVGGSTRVETAHMLKNFMEGKWC